MFYLTANFMSSVMTNRITMPLIVGETSFFLQVHFSKGYKNTSLTTKKCCIGQLNQNGTVNFWTTKSDNASMFCWPAYKEEDISGDGLISHLDRRHAFTLRPAHLK